MITLEIEGLKKFTDFSVRLQSGLSPFALMERVLVIANKAGVMLHEESVNACVAAIYGSAVLSYERTESLLHSIQHVVADDGLEHIINIDPEAVPEEGSRSLIDSRYRERWVSAGRETVLDYAIPVHEGYNQWFFGENTGNFVVGRPWFKDAMMSGGPKVVTFIELAFAEIMRETLMKAAA